MKYSLLFYFFISGIAMSAQQPQVVEGKGFKLFTVNTPDVTGMVAVVDPQVLKPKVIGYSRDRRAGITPLEAMFENDKPELVLGSGFVIKYYPIMPNGFLKINNRLINAVNFNSMNDNPKGYSTIIGVKQDRLRILPRSSPEVATLKEGFQVGPTLVTDGRKGSFTQALATRAFVGITADNKIVIGVTTELTNLNHLASFLVAPPTGYGSLKCAEAVNLSGAGAEALVARIPGQNTTFKFGQYNLYGASLLTFVSR